jgi:hypothetical protein
MTAATVLFAVMPPSAASADTLRPLTVTLTCTNNGMVGMPYGYQVTTGGALYYPPARSDATVSGSAKTFYLLIPTTATTLGVNTWCNGFDQSENWRGYAYPITPGTSTVNAVGRCDTALAGGFPGGGSYSPTYCTFSSITYS